MGQESGLELFYALTVLMFLAYLVFLAAATFWARQVRLQKIREERGSRPL